MSVDWGELMRDLPDERRPTMRHHFSGDPWGPCSGCAHPIYHPIHDMDELSAPVPESSE